MSLPTPYTLAFYVVLAATVVVGALEAWGAFVQDHGFDPLLTVSLSLMLIPLYVAKNRADPCNESSTC